MRNTNKNDKEKNVTSFSDPGRARVHALCLALQRFEQLRAGPEANLALYAETILTACLTPSRNIGTSEGRGEPNEVFENVTSRRMCSSCLNTFMLITLSSLTVVF